MSQQRRRGIRIPKLTRDAGIYVLGIFILLHETLIAHADRPTLIYAACALLGLPIVMRVDEHRNKQEDEAPIPPKAPAKKASPRPRKQTGGTAS